MSLTFQKAQNGATYVSIKESFWDPVRKKYTSRTVKNFGRLDRLLQEDPDILNKLEAEAERYKQLVKKEKQQALKQRIKNVDLSELKDFEQYRDNRVVMAGSCVYRQIWNKLDLQRKLRDLVKGTKISFNFADAVFYMTSARALMPDSKLSQWKKRNQFLFNASELQLNHLYRSLNLLCDNKASIVNYLNKRISKVYNRAISVVLYDVTTYAFESQDVDTLRAFGFSKDCKVNQVQVVMGLLIDKNGIPIDYELFPGNTSEFATMVPILKKIKEQYGIKNVIVTADRGLNSGNNLLAIRKLGMHYVIAYRLKNSSGNIKKLIAEEEGWQHYSVTHCGHKEVSRFKITTETRTVRVIGRDGSPEIQKITSNLLINYSPKRAKKDAHDRQRLVNKAERYAENPGLLKSDMRRGGKSFLKLDKDELSASVDFERIEKSAFYDGYYGIVYSDSSMSPDDVLSVHHSLWKIEESFRISKSLLEARPCFHWSEQRIRGHFFVCYLALVLQRLLEFELRENDIYLSSEEIIEALSGAQLLEVKSMDTEEVYCKSGMEGAFEKIAATVGLGKLPAVASTAQVKRALHLRDL